jgi:hypothetical protein
MTGIVNDGASRLQKACWKQAKAEVLGAHAESLRSSGLLRGLVLRWRLRREIRARARKLHPTVGRDTLF